MRLPNTRRLPCALAVSTTVRIRYHRRNTAAAMYSSSIKEKGRRDITAPSPTFTGREK